MHGRGRCRDEKWVWRNYEGLMTGDGGRGNGIQERRVSYYCRRYGGVVDVMCLSEVGGEQGCLEKRM